MRRYIWILLFTAACRDTTVYSVKTSGDGIPFFDRIAVHSEAIQIEQRWLRVDVTMTAKVPIEDKGAFTWVDQKSTVTAYFSGDAATAAVKSQLNQLAAKKDYDEARKAVLAFETAGNPAPPDPEGRTAVWDQLVTWKTQAPTKTPDPVEQRVVADACGIDRVAGSDQRYINVSVPHGGSSSATIKINGDGTLGEATGGVQDQLPGTIATGIGTLITAAGTLGGVAVTSSAAVQAAKIAALAGLGNTTQALFIGEPTKLPEPPKGVPPKALLLGLSAQTTPGRRLYTFGVQWPFAQFRHCVASGAGSASGSGASPNCSAAAAVVESNICASPCFAKDPAAIASNECVLSYGVSETAPAPAPTEKDKKPKKAGSTDE